MSMSIWVSVPRYHFFDPLYCYFLFFFCHHKTRTNHSEDIVTLDAASWRHLFWQVRLPERSAIIFRSGDDWWDITNGPQLIISTSAVPTMLSRKRRCLLCTIEMYYYILFILHTFNNFIKHLLMRPLWTTFKNYKKLVYTFRDTCLLQ